MSETITMKKNTMWGIVVGVIVNLTVPFMSVNLVSEPIVTPVIAEGSPDLVSTCSVIGNGVRFVMYCGAWIKFIFPGAPKTLDSFTFFSETHSFRMLTSLMVIAPLPSASSVFLHIFVSFQKHPVGDFSDVRSLAKVTSVSVVTQSPLMSPK